MRTARLSTVCRGGCLPQVMGGVCLRSRGRGVCLWKHNLRKLRLPAVKRGLLFCPIKLKLIYMARDRSILVNNDIFLSIPSAQPQELITCKFWRFINCIGVYGVSVYDLLTCWQMDWSVNCWRILYSFSVLCDSFFCIIVYGMELESNFTRFNTNRLCGQNLFVTKWN